MENVNYFLSLLFLFVVAPVLSILGGIMLRKTKNRKIWLFWALAMAITIFCLYETDGMNAIFRLAIVPFVASVFNPLSIFLYCFLVLANIYWSELWLSRILDGYSSLIFLLSIINILMLIAKHPKIAEGKTEKNKGTV